MTEDDQLQIEYYAKPEEDTPINMTNHSYFNLNGHESGSVRMQKMWIDAEAFIPTRADLIPTGEVALVEGTPMDFRVKKAIGRDIDQDYEALVLGSGYDHNWVLKDDGNYKKAAELSSDETGVTMEVYTDLPGVQVYTANFVIHEAGKDGVVYEKNQGVCFETQYFPDAVNHENFKSSICKKGDVYQTKTAFKFKHK